MWFLVDRPEFSEPQQGNLGRQVEGNELFVPHPIQGAKLELPNDLSREMLLANQHRVQDFGIRSTNNWSLHCMLFPTPIGVCMVAKMHKTFYNALLHDNNMEHYSCV